MGSFDAVARHSDAETNLGLWSCCKSVLAIANGKLRRGIGGTADEMASFAAASALTAIHFYSLFKELAGFPGRRAHFLRRAPQGGRHCTAGENCRQGDCLVYIYSYVNGSNLAAFRFDDAGVQP